MSFRFLQNHQSRSVATGIVALVGISVGVTYLITSQYYERLLAEFHPLTAVQTSYAFLDPLLGISSPNDSRDSLGGLRSAIQGAVAQEPQGALTRYALYFRDLKTATWTGINENDLYDPASLLKVIVAIAVFRQGEDNPSYLSEQLTYTSALDQINQQLAFAQPTELKIGQSYSIPFLVKAELADSDNGAVYTLLNSLSDTELDSVYEGLSIPKPNDASSVGYKISPIDYARFLRILYNGTYDLSWKHSNEILKALSESTFTTGLVAGVPSSIPVAHKYGEHISGGNGTAMDIELSDCGIIYYPQHPYLLCVMTEGKDPNVLASVIATISKTVYDSRLQQHN